jgi:oligopeptide/dipeptide ABC transporter ATP-binding protein
LTQIKPTDDKPEPRNEGDHKPILEIRNLKVHFQKRRNIIGRRQVIHAVDDVTLTIAPGEILSLVGESGSGKSTIARTIVKLNQPTAGEILYRDKNIFKLGREETKQFRRRVQMIFQDPYESLNPHSTAFESVIEPRIIHGLVPRSNRERTAVVDRLLKLVGLDPATRRDRYPHQLSGGERQRVSIARALSLEPDLLIADEPVSMLDVSIRLGVLHLLQTLKDEMKLTYLFITHDLGVARYIGTRIAVMYFGKIIEIARTDELINHPLHHYTNLLLSSVPGAEIQQTATTKIDVEYASNLADPPSGCRFHTRCPAAKEKCSIEEPKLVELRAEHYVACHYPLTEQPLQTS